MSEAERQFKIRQRVREAIEEAPAPQPGVLDRDVYTPEELAIVLQVGWETVTDWINRGDLPALKFGSRGGLRILREDVVAYLERLRDERSSEPGTQPESR